MKCNEQKKNVENLFRVNSLNMFGWIFEILAEDTFKIPLKLLLIVYENNICEFLFVA